MIFTFDIEGSYNNPNYSRSYTIDITNERMQRNINYEQQWEFGRAYSKRHYSRDQSFDGEIISEITFNNVAWSYLCASLMGQRTEITDYKFAESNNPWGILIGHLSADLAVDSTNFSIIGDSTSSFDGVDAVIINNEFIQVASLSQNEVISCSRGTQGTTSRLHAKSDLVYGVSEGVSRAIVMCHRKKTGPFCIAGPSLTTVFDRGGSLYGYSGVQVSKMALNFRTFDIITVHMELNGADSTNLMDLSETSTTDDNDIVGMSDVFVYSNYGLEPLRQIWLNIDNTMEPGSFGFNGKPQNLFLTKASSYGTLTWREESDDIVRQYEEDEKRDFSVSISRGDYRMIIALNNVRINTPSHYLDGELIIQDSSPYYMYEDPVILFQY
jgi:hypothetical protein